MWLNSRGLKARRSTGQCTLIDERSAITLRLFAVVFGCSGCVTCLRECLTCQFSTVLLEVRRLIHQQLKNTISLSEIARRQIRSAIKIQLRNIYREVPA